MQPPIASPRPYRFSFFAKRTQQTGFYIRQRCGDILGVSIVFWLFGTEGAVMMNNSNDHSAGHQTYIWPWSWGGESGPAYSARSAFASPTSDERSGSGKRTKTEPPYPSSSVRAESSV